MAVTTSTFPCACCGSSSSYSCLCNSTNHSQFPTFISADFSAVHISCFRLTHPASCGNNGPYTLGPVETSCDYAWNPPDTRIFCVDGYRIFFISLLYRNMVSCTNPSGVHCAQDIHVSFTAPGFAVTATWFKLDDGSPLGIYKPVGACAGVSSGVGSCSGGAAPSLTGNVIVS